MATLTADQTRDMKLVSGLELVAIPVIATDIIYQGAAIGESSSAGTARPLVAGDTFLGFAFAKADNALGAAGDVNVESIVVGYVKLDVTGVTGIADLGVTVYASDDNAFTLTVGSNTAIGKITEHVSGTTCWVRFEAAFARSL